MATQTSITNLVVNSVNNCYQLTPEQIEGIQNKGVTAELTPGIYVVRIKEGAFDYIKDSENAESEAIVMLWIYGGFKNLKTSKQVTAGWSTLNGYDDTLTIAVSKPSKLCAFFFDTEIKDNAGDVTVSVVKVDELRDFN
ncbi:hypothetical protein [Iningainema tapete]|uniref:Uncharacterized protein n=1 Tax=Iningainema tapete BLCC-T55 TaxID=2748662 RepID=A0A8J6Y1R5_9CYAN|nr:hypothetical protein [Iningainema tapete]MBD2777763.1 hypothetical protein [Iningainema tapete BLCC-T55]